MHCYFDREMVKTETKARSVRKALRDASNNHNNGGGGGGGGRFSKSVNAKNSVSEKENEKQPIAVSVQQGEAEGEGEDCLDRLLLVQSDLSSLTHQIDELVAQAFNVKATNKQGRKEIESFTDFLSDMLSSLKTWVPRFEKALSSPSSELENQLNHSLVERTVSTVDTNEKFLDNSPEKTKMDSLISPSPLVSWRANCNIERGRQLFLLTPLPISKTSSTCQDLSKSVFERVTLNPSMKLPSFLTVCRHVNNNLLGGIGTKSTSTKPSNSTSTEETGTSEHAFVPSPLFSKRDHSVLIMTPCLKTSPPKSCVLLEPGSEFCHKGNDRVWKSTPFPVGIHSPLSESPGSESSKDLTLKYPELLGIQGAYKSRMGKKELQSSPDWSFSPPKTCVLLEPPDEKSLGTLTTAHPLPINNLTLNQHQQNQIKKSVNQEPIGLTLVESTPLWKEPESTMRTGKFPGENTLKRELWTRFEAASTHGLHLNVSAFQGTAKKGFLDMLNEVSCDGDL